MLDKRLEKSRETNELCIEKLFPNDNAGYTSFFFLTVKVKG